MVETTETALPSVQEIKDMTPEQRSVVMLQAMLQVVQMEGERSIRTEKRVDKLEEDAPIRAYQDHLLEKARRRRVVSLLGGKQSAAYQNQALARKMFRAIMVDYRNRFGVEAYQDTPRQEFRRALKFYDAWEPDFELHEAVTAENDKEVSAND